MLDQQNDVLSQIDQDYDYHSVHMPIERRREPRKATKLPVLAQSYGLVENGLYSGHAAHLIGFSGCLRGCEFCESEVSKEKFHPEGAQMLTPRQIEASLKDVPRGALVVLCGGEPCLYELDELIQLLQRRFNIHIETSGRKALPAMVDWVTVIIDDETESLNPMTVARANEFLVKVTSEQSINNAVAKIEKRRTNAPIWLEPAKGLDYDPVLFGIILEYIRKGPEKFRYSATGDVLAVFKNVGN